MQFLTYLLDNILALNASITLGIPYEVFTSKQASLVWKLNTLQKQFSDDNINLLGWGFSKISQKETNASFVNRRFKF